MIGVWDVDFDYAKIFCYNLIEDKVREVFKKQYFEYKNGKKWFIKDFISFQYGELKNTNPLHKSVISKLKGENLFQEYLRGMHTPQVKVKDKVKEKDIDLIDPDILFPEIWNRYPNRDGMKKAKKHFTSSVKTMEDWKNINKALDNYLESDKVKKGYIKNGSTWFNNWQDWINFKGVKGGENKKSSQIDYEKGKYDELDKQ